ncbi:hypothetical protein BDR26DRAFT_902599 [Obelidium mucronatum]|nr:hypothetical protein BDR26DRAFT_902599 [Obelidium mucronatum]
MASNKLSQDYELLTTTQMRNKFIHQKLSLNNDDFAILIAESDYSASIIEKENSTARRCVDSNGYPLAPNGIMISVFAPVTEASNQAFFKHYSEWQLRNMAGTEYRDKQFRALVSKNHFRNHEYAGLVKACCGLFKCSQCDWIGRPEQSVMDGELGKAAKKSTATIIIPVPLAWKKIPNHPTGTENREASHKVCDICGGIVNWESCLVKQSWFWTKDHSRGILVNSGTHNHVVPPVNLPDPDSTRVFNTRVKDNPKKTASQLAQPDVTELKLDTVHEAFANKGAINYRRGKVLLTLPWTERESGGMVASFIWLQELFPRCLQSSSLDIRDMHFSFATEWMEKLSMDPVRINSDHNGNLITDVTYSYFREYLLCTTTVYDEVINHWVPVLCTLMQGLTVNHYRCHFRVLIKWSIIRHITAEFMELDSNDQYNLKDKYKDETATAESTAKEAAYTAARLCVGQGVDFSMAQRNAFVEEYAAQFFKVRKNMKLSEVSLDMLKLEAESVIIGCSVHFLSSANRIQRNHFIVGPDDKDNFTSKVYAIMREKSDATFREKVKGLVLQYPRAKKWIDFWIRGNIAKMVFLSQREMDPAFEAMSKENSNPIEALHNYYYCILGSQFSLARGVQQLLCLGVHFEDLHLNMINGIRIRYGQAERWKKVQEAFGKEPKDMKEQRGATDGRAPDTTSTLLSSKVRKDEVAYQQGAMTKFDDSVFASANPEGAIKTAAGKPGRKKGGTNSVRTEYASFKSFVQKENMCYGTALLEAIYAAIGLAAINLVVESHPETFILNLILNHLRERGNSRISDLFVPMDTRKYSHLMKQVQAFSAENTPYKLGEQGNPVHLFVQMMKKIVQPPNKVHSFTQLFQMTKEQHFECPQGHMLIKDSKENFFRPGGEIKETNWVVLQIVAGDTPTMDFQDYLNDLSIGHHCGDFSKFRDREDQELDSTCPHPNCEEPIFYRYKLMTTWPAKIMVAEFNIAYEHVDSPEITGSLKTTFGSQDYNFPLIVYADGSKWTLTSRIFSTHETGQHFYSQFQREKGYGVNTGGVYIYNDIKNFGHAQIMSQETAEILGGKRELTSAVFYVRTEDAPDSRKVPRQRGTGALNAYVKSRPFVNSHVPMAALSALPKPTITVQETFCVCKLPYSEDNGDMIQCEKCLDWFHWKCVKLNASKVKKIRKYLCSVCKQVMKKD